MAPPPPPSRQFQYPFAPALAAFLDRRAGPAPFRFGDWLATLTYDELTDFEEQLDLFQHDNPAVHRQCRETAWVLLTAEAAEHQVTVPVTPTEKFPRLVARALTAVIMENLRRKRWVYVEGRLTLRPKQVPVYPTAYGRACNRREAAHHPVA